MTPDSELIAQCAESKIYAHDFFGTPAVCKHRFVKAYRHPQIDQKLREQRTVREARALVRCRKHGVRTPVVFAVDSTECRIIMERIQGVTVKAALDRVDNSTAADGKTSPTTVPPPLVRTLLEGIGEVVGLMHNADVIHGDLTTSNFMWTDPATSHPAGGSSTESGTDAAQRDGLVVIDFGLVSDKNSPEDRAVDLYVLERAIVSAHPFIESYASNTILKGYRRTANAKKAASTLQRLDVVRARGRKRSMIG